MSEHSEKVTAGPSRSNKYDKFRYNEGYSNHKRRKIEDHYKPENEYFDSESSTSKRNNRKDPPKQVPIEERGKLLPEMSDPYFHWTEYQHTLNKIFFRDRDSIPKGSRLYDDFWAFLQKYQAMQQIAKAKGTCQSNTSENCNIFSIDEPTMTDMLMRGYLFKDDRRSMLTEERLTEFQYVIYLFLDFLEKKKAEKLRKLREGQENLPIRQHRDGILDAVRKHQVIVVAGDTGCGKSTQVPQYLLAAGYNNIACTQPRRIACISLRNRVAYETQNEYGTEIGYQIRFEKSKTSNTKMLFLTEGLLLRQVSSDPMLSMYDVLILDEVHERHLPCDFLLGIMKCLTVQRPDVKIILMSATINIELFSEYFNSCPVIQVPGRLFPIEVKYCPVPLEEKKASSGRLNPAPYIRIMNMIDHKYPDTERGDLLIFMSGMTEISIIEEAAKMYADKTKKWIILALHSTLSLEEQDKVFDSVPESVRKCIISTNIAETSITIDGIRFVVDSGKVKEMSYDPECHMQRLQEFWISQASAEQRKGRAGRTGPGSCYRLYSEKEFAAMALYSKPEIQRVALDSLILQMMSLGLPDPRKFPFLEPPALSSIEESVQSLKEQGALTDEEILTPMGKMLSRLPVEVTIGKMLIYGSMFSVVEPVLSLAAALSVQSPFTSRSIRDPDLLAARRLLDSDHGDPFTLLNAYHKWLEAKADHRGNSRQWCRKRGLEEQRFYEMSKLRRQFKDLLRDAGLMPEEEKFASSYERSYRHGELRHLKDMKKQYHQAPKTRKVLKLDSGLDGYADHNEENDGKVDIKDVEFRMLHDRKQVFQLSNSTQVTSYHEIVCLKVIVCSGLYPRGAIADVHNSYKSDADQHFHTKGKPFTVLHPNGVFALQPDLLRLNQSDIMETKNFRSQTPVSTRHQLLVYMSLLETTKPFLVNCLRVQAAHALLLFSHSLDTNEDFTRVVCDQWIELRFPEPIPAHDFVTKVLNIRDSWLSLLKKTFEEFSMDKEAKMSTVRALGKELLLSISKFFMIEIPCCIKRLLAADVKSMYTAVPGDITSSDVSSLISNVEDCFQNTRKGGLQVRDYMTYNCLSDSEDRHLKYIQKVFICPYCEQQMIANVLDQIRHKEKCKEETEKGEKKPETEENKSENSLKKNYFCDICDKEIQLTVSEIFKHKKSHS